MSDDDLLKLIDAAKGIKEALIQVGKKGDRFSESGALDRLGTSIEKGATDIATALNNIANAVRSKS